MLGGLFYRLCWGCRRRPLRFGLTIHQGYEKGRAFNPCMLLPALYPWLGCLKSARFCTTAVGVIGWGIPWQGGWFLLHEPSNHLAWVPLSLPFQIAVGSMLVAFLYRLKLPMKTYFFGLPRTACERSLLLVKPEAGSVNKPPSSRAFEVNHPRALPSGTDLPEDVLKLVPLGDGFRAIAGRGRAIAPYPTLQKQQ